MNRPLLLVLLVATIAPGGSAHAIAAETITHESMWMMKRVGSPALSPDGRRVVVSVTEPAYDGDEEVSDLWLVAADGSSEPKRLTSTRASESGVAWSPDGGRIAFATRREQDDRPQIYVLDLSGGEARRVSSVALGARSPVWSPDGSKIAFLAGAYPGAADDEENRRLATERKERKSTVRIYESFPIRRWDRWLDEVQTRLWVADAKPGATPRDLLAGTTMLTTPGFAPAPASGSSDSLQPVWAPDGRSIVFVASLNRDRAAYDSTNTHLFEVSLEGGEPRQLTSGTADHGRPRFRPGGRELCFTTSDRHRRIYALTRVGCAEWPWKAPVRSVTAASDRSVLDWAFTPDGRTIWFTAEDAGMVKLYTVAAGGGSASLAFEPEGGVYSGLEVEGEGRRPVIVANWSSSIRPAEVVRIDPAAKGHRLVTRFAADDAAKLSWQPPRHFWFTNEEGMRIHSLLFLPPDFDETKKYPLLVLIHGGAHSMWRDAISLRWNYHLLSAPGYVLLATNYRGSTGFGEELALSILGDPLRGPANDVNAAADEAIRRFPFIDGTRQAAAGASYGGHLANWLQGTTTRYRALISHAGLATLAGQWGTSDVIFHRELMLGGPPWEGNPVWQEQSPLAHAARFSTPMLLSVGENDYRVPMNNTIELWSALQRQRVPSRLLVWAGENHWILGGENSRVFYREVHDWLARWLDAPSDE
ncbi:MAG TPA: S9 family peptidase [Thermoanaerobaculia bacterium]|nr:S9 family peptidase [Thermoanaerobaculia bacterium]